MQTLEPLSNAITVYEDLRLWNCGCELLRLCLRRYFSELVYLSSVCCRFDLCIFSFLCLRLPLYLSAVDPSTALRSGPVAFLQPRQSNSLTPRTF